MLLGLFGFIHFNISAQALINGGAKGIIVDSLKEPVPGIIVSIENTSFSTLTDISGNFSFFNIPAGNYKLIITALGFQKTFFDFTISGSQVTDIGKIILYESANNLNDIVIVGKINGEAKAINQTKTSTRLVTITSAEEIAKLPNKNAADIVAHNPGVAIQRNKGEGSIISIRGTPSDWTAVLVNGDRLPVACEENTSRSFEFEAFPADLVDHVVESRTVTPDLESDNIGGSMNFFTKNPEYKKSFNLNVAGGYNILAKKPTGTLNILYGDVSKNKKFSFVINSSNYSRYYASDAEKVVYGSNFNHGINRLELRNYDGFRSTIGGNISMEYKFNSKIKVGTHLFSGWMLDAVSMKKQSFDWFDESGQRIRLQNTYGILDRRILGGDVYSEIKPNDRLKVQVRVASYDNRFKYGPFPNKDRNDLRNGFYVMEFSSPLVKFTDFSVVDKNGKAIDQGSLDFILLKLIGKDEPYGKGNNPNNIQPAFSNSILSKDFKFSQSYAEGNNTGEKDPVVGQLDVEYKISNNLYLQAGGKYREKTGYRHITKHEWFQDFTTGANPIWLTDFKTEMFAQKGDGFLKELGANYQDLFYSFLTQDALKGFVHDYNGKLREVYMNEMNAEYRLWVGSNYDYTEQQEAGYSQLNYSTDKMNILGGVRVENTKLFESSDTLTDILAFDTLTSTYYYLPKKSYTHLQYIGILPSVNASFYIKDNINLRLAASRTMHRPNFEETKPGHAVIRYNDLEYTFGNPKLKPAFSLNLDANLEYYYGARGMWSIGSYFKRIKDHIYAAVTSDVDPLSGIIIKKYDNSPHSWVFGLEGIFIRKFNFLTGFWKDFGVNTNISLSMSQMEIPGRPKSQPMTEQTPLLLNFAITYAKNGFDSKLAFGYNGRYLTQVNLATQNGIGLVHKDSDYDTYMRRYYSLDYQISYKFKEKYTIYVEANNLLNSPEKKYIGQEWRISYIEYYRPKAQIGFKVNI